MRNVVTADDLIRHYRLEPLPVEGGLFVQTYRSSDTISPQALPDRYGRQKPIGTAILYLYTDDRDSFSAFHRLPSDEIYHFYLGDPLELVQLRPDGESERIILGQDVLGGQRVQYVVPAGVWTGSRLLLGGRFALIGTTMAPGFTPDDYEGGRRTDLIRLYPDEAEIITDLTRPDDPLMMPET